MPCERVTYSLEAATCASRRREGRCSGRLGRAVQSGCKWLWEEVLCHVLDADLVQASNGVTCAAGSYALSLRLQGS